MIQYRFCLLNSIRPFQVKKLINLQQNEENFYLSRKFGNILEIFYKKKIIRIIIKLDNNNYV